MSNNTDKNQNYKSKFNFNEDNLDYEIQLIKKKKCRWNWRWLWLLLLPLLLFLLYLLFKYLSFPTRTGYDIENEDIENIEVVLETECDIIRNVEVENNNDIIDADEDQSGKKSLEQFFPPVINQGLFGTCVCFSTGYNLMTALNAIEKRWTKEDLEKAENQTSPKDLWMQMPLKRSQYDLGKNPNCGGSYFETAFEVLQNKGAASLKTVPYQMSNCCNLEVGVGDANNKIAKWRTIATYSTGEGMNVDNFKNYLNRNIPVVFGANVGKRFDGWTGSNVYDGTGDHSTPADGHAMTLVGYDDSKNAFRVRNSWGNTWADKGSIWVDYDYFVNTWCKYAFVAFLKDEDEIEDVVVDTTILSGNDIMISYTSDTEVTGKAGYRKLTFDIFNSGNNIISSGEEWVIAGMLYNAKNAKEHYIISWMFVSKEYANDVYAIANNDVLSGNDTYTYFRLKPNEKKTTKMQYKLPNNLNGKYYMVLLADVRDDIKEVNKRNNFWFISAEDKEPLLFENGKMMNQPAMIIPYEDGLPEPYSNHLYQTLVKPGNLNTYTPGELKRLIQCELNKKLNKSN